MTTNYIYKCLTSYPLAKWEPCTLFMPIEIGCSMRLILDEYAMLQTSTVLSSAIVNSIDGDDKVISQIAKKLNADYEAEVGDILVATKNNIYCLRKINEL